MFFQNKKFNSAKKLKHENGAGFTLIEMIVVITIFLFIVGAAISIFIFVIQNQRRVLAEQEVLSQIGYAEEHMSKALRMATIDKTGTCLVDHAGYQYLLTRPVGGFFTGIKFLNQSYTDTENNPICQEFYFDSATGVLKELINNNPDTSAVDLTSPKMKIESVRFAVNEFGGAISSAVGTSNKDGTQPRVTILLQVKVPGDNQEPVRTIQTTVSQRNLNTR